MKTKKLTLNELRNIIKESIKEELNPNLDEYRNYRRDSEFRSRERNAGVEGTGRPIHYEVETGEMIWPEEYDKWEHGKILGVYNSDGEKIGDGSDLDLD